MSLPHYATYKTTGVEWLGAIPSHWKLDRLKRSVTRCKNGIWGDEAQQDENDVICVRVADFDRQSLKVELNDPTIRNVTEKERTGRVLKRGDLLLEKSGGGENQPVGCVVLFDDPQPAVCSNFVARMQIADEMCPTFWRYVHAAAYAIRLTTRSINQTSGIQNLDQDRYFNEQVPFPPLEEQQTIADFLDAQSAKIYTLLAKKRQFIAKLKEKRSALIARTVTRGLPPAAAQAAGLEPYPAMKDSGVEWLGEIPAHWNVRPIRYLFKNLDSKRIPLSGEDRATLEKLYPYYGASGIIDQVDEYIFDEPLILVAEDGANLLSRSSPLAFLATGKYWVNNHAHILRPIIGDISYWVSVLQTFDFTPLVTGAAQPKLTADRLGGIRLPVPPVEEQQAIAAYLDRETARLDQLTAKVEAAIARLTEYRQALITAAVTGKIDVRALTPTLSRKGRGG